MSKGIITLITDFGTKDHYVGAMKGVMLGINPEVALIDVSHEVPAGNVHYGSYMLSQIYPLYPDGTVHLVVIDPGVGSERRPLALMSGNRFFVGPDNGVFTPVLKSGQVHSAVEITEREYFPGRISATFHGRDVFAPVAAHLSLGTVRLRDLGPPAGDPSILDGSRPPGRGGTRSDMGTYGGSDNGELLEAVYDLFLYPTGPTTVNVGEPIFFDALIWNSTDNPATGNYWLSVILPNQVEVLIPEGLLNLQNPTQGIIPAHGTSTLSNELQTIRAGTYTLIARIGAYPNVVIDEESFEVQVN